jgi:DNA polymerase III epsilon subunit family exonuclease
MLRELNYNVKCVFEKISQESSGVLLDRKDRMIEDNMIFEEMKKSQVVELQNIENVFGEYQFKTANIAGEIGDGIDIAVVGNVKSCFIRETKAKIVEDKDGNEVEKEPKKYMTLELEFENQVTRCSWFFKKNMEIPEEFKVGEVLAVFGKVDEYNGQKSVRISSIARCTFNPPKKVWRKCPSTYRFIKPEPYEFTEQIGLFFEDKKTDNKYLLNNTFVVYDLETTGINPETCKIIDIGAFKIVEGRIVEKFCTFVNPECEIPEEASKVNRITNALVENSPTIEKALPDFYKFCNGSIIVGYNNIGFDDLFINKEGRKQFYNFDNKRDDVFNIAKENVFGLNNYKLSTVCNAMSVPLIDAHRAANDALATAKLFIKLVEKYYK